MVLKDPDAVRLAFKAALNAEHVDYVPEFDPPEDPFACLLRDIRISHVIEEQSNADLVKLFNTYCRDMDGELTGIPNLIADEMCDRVDPGWEYRGTNQEPTD